jgi:transcriptional regulator with XRE-family HTH domain
MSSIRDRRVALKMGLRAVADRAGIDIVRLGEIERGVSHPPTKKELAAIASALIPMSATECIDLLTTAVDHAQSDLEYDGAPWPRFREALAQVSGELACLRAQCRVHETSITTWGRAFGRVVQALGLRGDGHADVLAQNSIAEIERLKAIEAAARDACERFAAGDRYSLGTFDAVQRLRAALEAKP